MFGEPVVLEGNHVRLEPLARGHVDGLWAVGSDPEIWRWMGVLVDTREKLEAYVAEALRWQDEGTAVPFATIEQASGTVVGTTRFANIVPEHKRAEIGWTWVGAAWQRTAVNTEAKYLMLRHAFETWGMNRVELKTDVLNEKSRRAIERLGATQEAVLRAHMVTEGGRLRDTVYYSILRGEWPAVGARLRERLEGRS